jgi:hypothetical protein
MTSELVTPRSELGMHNGRAVVLAKKNGLGYNLQEDRV